MLRNVPSEMHGALRERFERDAARSEPSDRGPSPEPD
jgi:hypothetical protein